MDSLKGRLLISNGNLYDPNFRHTVVLVVEHGDDGALGLVLNRPAPITVMEAIPDLAVLVDPDEHLYVGGPVQPEAAVVLAEYEDTIAVQEPLSGTIAVLGHIDPDHVAGIKRARVFGGYSGWAPGQLEEELSSNDWILEDAQAQDVFTDDPGKLWSAILERKGGPYRMLSRMPFDPSNN